MDDEELIRTDVEFAVADAHWRHELARERGAADTEESDAPPAWKGEPETALRAAYEERLRALRAWRRARGIA